MLAPEIFSYPAYARDRLGMFSTWAAFRDPAVPLCYAIAKADHVWPKSNHAAPYVDIAEWPDRKISGMVHFHLARIAAPGKQVLVRIAKQRFALTSDAADAWSTSPALDTQLVSAMRGGGLSATMTLVARDTSGRRFGASWKLAGAASAMDAALIGCAQRR